MSHTLFDFADTAPTAWRFDDLVVGDLFCCDDGPPGLLQRIEDTEKSTGVVVNAALICGSGSAVDYSGTLFKIKPTSVVQFYKEVKIRATPH